MPRGGRSSGGGGIRSYSSAKTAKAPAPAKGGGGAPAPATSTGGGGGGGLLSNAASVFAEGWIWCTSWALANRAMDAVLGPRTFRIEHTAAAATTTTTSPSDASSSPCEIHAMAFQDCINQNGSDISKCQFYVNILNDCRRRGQVAAETSG
ncbi:hypothetical protein BDA96_08G207800 [Sorghum bicolor]|uniref:CHCH domain-containing protein n=1 Tax=Sorghum bicolor TaxID=4558 RepID=A0A921QK45_SORBI|nr:hypothetical protein BDA96_08G207800 [Sorghum bicolor]